MVLCDGGLSIRHVIGYAERRRLLERFMSSRVLYKIGQETRRRGSRTSITTVKDSVKFGPTSLDMSSSCSYCLADERPVFANLDMFHSAPKVSQKPCVEDGVSRRSAPCSLYGQSTGRAKRHPSYAVSANCNTGHFA